MHHVLIRFGLYHLVVLDDDNPFKGSFNTMCQVLLLNSDVLAKRKQRRCMVDHYHRFFNKNITISAKDRGTNDIFVRLGAAAS